MKYLTALLVFILPVVAFAAGEGTMDWQPIFDFLSGLSAECINFEYLHGSFFIFIFFSKMSFYHSLKHS